MKRCPKCNDMALYDNTVALCPICDSPLISAAPSAAPPCPDAGSRNRTAPSAPPAPGPQDSRPPSPPGSGAQEGRRRVVRPVTPPAPDPPARETDDRTNRRRTAGADGPRAQDTQAPQFERRHGREFIFRGRVTEVNSLSRPYTRLHKIIHLLLRREPYQFGDLSYETTIRIENFTIGTLSDQSRDLILYGDIEGRVHIGDDITVSAVQRGGRYVIRHLQNHATESDVSPGPQLSVLACAVLAAVVVALLFAIVHGVISFFTNGGFEALLLAIVNLIILVFVKLLPVIVVLWILSLFLGIGRRR